MKLFQQSGLSSDITFAYELIAVINDFVIEDPGLSISSSGNVVTIRWCDLSDTLLYEASSVDAPPQAWSPVVGAARGHYSFAVGAAAAQKFYSLRR